MFETPRIVPHEVVQDDGGPHTETRQIDIAKYGDCYDPHGYTRTYDAPALDPDHDGDPA